MRDLEVLVPPKYMIFRRASFQTGTRMHIYFCSSVLVQNWGWEEVGVGEEVGGEAGEDV